MTNPSHEKDPGFDGAPVHEWQEAAMAADSLVSGDLVVGFEVPTDLDIFANNLVQTTLRDIDGNFRRNWMEYSLDRPTYHLSNSGKATYDNWREGTKSPSEAIRSKGFFGEFRNMVIVILDDTLDRRYGSDRVDIKKNFILLADMYSTGRGVIGKVAKQCTISHPYRVNASYKNLPTHSAEAAVAAVKDEASQNSRQLVIKGLRTVFSGGLPSLGKDR